MFEINQVKCQLLGYDTVQTGKYLVGWLPPTFTMKMKAVCYSKMLLPT